MSTDIFCWNIRGLNKYSYRSGLRKWFRKNYFFFGGLFEIHVKQAKMNKFVFQLFPGWFSVENYGFFFLGKIWVVWYSFFLVTVISKSVQMICVEVIWFSDLQFTLFISVIYVSNDPSDRIMFWFEFVILVSVYDFNSKLWLVVGDFNQIRDLSEYFLFFSLNMDKRIREFNQCFSVASLEDLNYRGTTFTWWNKRKFFFLVKKLDRCLANEEWYNTFFFSVVFFGSSEFSDYVFIIVIFEFIKIRFKKFFKFYNFILQNSDFIVTVCVNWFFFNVAGSAMFIVSKKFKLLKNVIREFSKQNYSGIEKKTVQVFEKLIQI